MVQEVESTVGRSFEGVEGKCKWRERMKVSMSQVFDTEEPVKAVLKFLKEMDVGRVSGVS